MFQNLNFFPKNVNLYPTGQNCVILGTDVPNKIGLPNIGREGGHKPKLSPTKTRK
jgi:hypothetical protein